MKDRSIYRYAEERDLPALTEIYNYYILNSTATFDVNPVSIEQRRIWFSHYAPDSRYKLIVAEHEEQIIGYTSTSKFREKEAYAQSVESSIYIHPEHQKKGLGAALYARLFEALKDTDVHRVFACITLPNEASIALHTRFGFQQVGRFSEAGYKFGEYRDVLWMEKAL
ncbi:MAG: N-acetyltransferase [Sphaerochaetaceae bacterium]|nr:N-acetyltransferase [Sphaerochaetaceae bacterium]